MSHTKHGASRSRTTDSSMLLAAMIEALQNGSFGLVRSSAEVLPIYCSYEESKTHLSGVENGFILRLPFAGTTVKFEMLFNLSDPLLTPDFICMSDEDFYPDIEGSIPALARWGENRQSIPLTVQIVTVVEELLSSYQQHQHAKIKHQYPALRRDCLGEVDEAVEVCLEMIPATSGRSSDAASPPKASWYLHALTRLPSLPSKTHQYLSNPQDAKGRIYFYWGLTLAPSSSGNNAPSSQRPTQRAEIALLRNDTIRDFFQEFGFKTPSFDSNETFSVTSSRYFEAFNSFLSKTPQSLERRRAILELFSERFPIIHIDRRRWAFASYLVKLSTPSQQGSALLDVAFNSLQSSALPMLQLVSAYPIQRIPGAKRDTYPVKMQNLPNNIDQITPMELVEKTHSLLGHVAPPFIGSLVH